MSKLSQYAGQGTETIEDTNRAYLKLAQKMSPEIDKENASYIKGLEAGQFFNSMTKKIYGTEVNLIVLATRKNYALVDDDNKFKGFSDTIQPTWSRDVTGVLRSPEGYKCVLNYGYVVVEVSDVKDDGSFEPMVLTLKATDVRTARDWNTELKNLRLDAETLAPIFAGVWKIKATYNKNDKGAWYTCGGQANKPTFVEYIPDSLVDSIAAASNNIINAQLAAKPQVALITDKGESDI